MVTAAGKGSVRALYILGEDPAMTDPDLNHVRRCLDAAEFIVLQEIFPSETSAYADVLLPGSSFAEKDGTFTNTERRVQLVRKAIEPLGEACSDWSVIADVARTLIELEGTRAIGPHAGWEYQHPEQIMEEIAALVPQYAGVSHARLRNGDQLQWPVNDVTHAGTPILHREQFACGKGRFHPADYLEPAERPDKEYPFLLTTGRVLYHWHGGELTRRVAGLTELCAEAYVELHPTDAAKLGVIDTEPIRLASRRGQMTARAFVTTRVTQGVVFGNFHFPAAENVNNLTNAALDPIAKIPEYKACAVRVERLDVEEAGQVKRPIGPAVRGPV